MQNSSQKDKENPTHLNQSQSVNVCHKFKSINSNMQKSQADLTPLEMLMMQ